MTEPPQIARGPEAPHFETTNVTVPTTPQECRKPISCASPRSEGSAAPGDEIEVLGRLEHRAFHTLDGETAFAFGRWAAWALRGGDEPHAGVRDLAATAITILRPFVGGDEADALDLWDSMLRERETR